MATLAEIYDWFMTGKKPSQAQFWASWGSFWNKGEQIPQSAVSNLTTVLNAKAEKAQFDAHKTDANAHAALFETKEDKENKGAANGYVPLNEFVKIANEYLTIVDDLITGGSTSLASAETVKTLKTQIDGINTLLTSNDVNLDTVQEIVDAIKTVETSLSTILVNDLTTGGTTKALTAEMGKTLKGLIDGLYTNETIDTLLAGKANQILALKTITGTTYNVIYDDISNELVYEGTVAMNVIIPNNATLALPIGTVFYSVATNTGILSVSGGAGVVFQTAVGLSGTQNEVRKYTKRGINTWGIEGNVVSSSDMILASTQTVSGLKTFLNGVFGLRNVANTFTSFFTNANTASRTYTLQNRNGTLADDTDLAGKMANPTGGIASYLPKFLTGNTMGLSRLWDTGSFFGIGTTYTPSKDLTLGNQNNRDIGIEESDAVTKGRDLTISAGRTNDYLINSLFNALGTGFSLNSVTISTSGDIYILKSTGDILKQTAGIGSFVSINPNITSFSSIAIAPNGNLYGVRDGTGDTVYMQTGGSGNFNAVGRVNYLQGLTIAPNGDVYVSGWYNGDIYKQTGGVGAFNSLGQTNRYWKKMCVAPNGDVYATTYNSDIRANVISSNIYKQTGGVGDFISTGQVSRAWNAITATPNGNIYATVDNGDVYMQVGGTGGFNPTGQVSRGWSGIASYPSGNIYATAGDLYFMDLSAKGAPNLDGGTFKAKAGTGKGLGKSRFEIWTGQKLSSGTDMQIETLREYVDENGYHIYSSIPVYADNASAIAGGLPIGCEYRTATGVKMIVY